MQTASEFLMQPGLATRLSVQGPLPATYLQLRVGNHRPNGPAGFQSIPP